ncbi:MAG: hypothetical protein RR518_00605 [Coprobacillus sp.]
MKLENDSDYITGDKTLENIYKNTLPYAAKGSIRFIDTQTKEEIVADISSDIMKKLNKGETLDFSTSPVLKSNSTYSYTMEILDRFSHAIPTTPEKIKGTVKTAKTTPVVKVKINENKAGSFKLKLSLSDIDNAIIDSYYTVKICDEGGEPLNIQYEKDGVKETAKEIQISKEDKDIDLSIYNLPFSQKLYIKAIANYNIEDNTGDKKKEICNSAFYSASIGNGTLNYTNSFTNILGTSATININMNTKSSTSLADLMNEITFELTSDKNDKVGITIQKEMFDNVDIQKFYDDTKKQLIIQQGEKNKPEILLSVSKELLLSGVTPWQAFINGAYFETSAEKSGSLHITMTEGTLSPSTKYIMKVLSKANQGGYIYDLQTMISKDNFITKKREPQIIYEDYFQGQKFFEFYGLQVNDIDKTLLDDKYTIQLVRGEEVIESHTYLIGDKIEKMRFESLSDEDNYEIRFVAAQYNDGQTAGTLQRNFTFKTFTFRPTLGIEGSIELNDMQFTYDNQSVIGNIDKEKVMMNKGIDDEGHIIDKEGYFVTDYLPVDSTKGLYLKDFGAGLLRMLAYDTNNRVVQRFYNQTYADGMGVYFDRTVINNYYQWKNIRVQGRIENLNNSNMIQIDNPKDAFIGVNIINDAFLDVGSGFQSNHTAYNSTDYIEVTPGDIYYKLNGPTVFYDKEKKYIGGRHQTENVIVVPTNAAYMRWSFGKGRNEQLLLLQEAKNQKVISLEETLTDNAGLLQNVENYYITQYETNVIGKDDYKISTVSENHLTYENGKIKPVSQARTVYLENGKSYKFEISIQYHGRVIVLDECEVESDKLTYVIKSISDFQYIKNDTWGNYIVVNDIVETQWPFLSDFTFNGTLDFQGHTLSLGKGRRSNFDVGKSGTLKNVRFVGVAGDDLGYNVVRNNYGIMENIIYAPNALGDQFRSTSFMRDNYGKINNFIIEFDGESWVKMVGTNVNSTVFVRNNFGIIENGYIYNKTKNGHIYVRNDGGIVTQYSSGIIKNIYAITDIYANSNYSGIITADYRNPLIENIFVVGDMYKFTTDTVNDRPIDGGYNLSLHPIRHSNGSAVNKNVYLVSENPQYAIKCSEYTSKKQLWDKDFYDTNINKENTFEVDSLVELGYYPQLKMDSCMDKYQPYIKLPEVEDGIAPKVVDSVVTKQTEDYADVTIKMTNPNNDIISNITVDNVDCIIFEQQVVNHFYEVKVKVSNPKVYVSEYKISKFDYRSTHTENSATVTDSSIKAEFYKPINSFNDWMIMASNQSQNYRLKTDLDFSTVSNYNSIYLTKFTGKFDGGKYDADGKLIGMHTISNINPPSDFSKVSALIDAMNGTFKNVRIQGFEWMRDTTLSTALINTTIGEISNIHIRDISLEGTDGIISGLVNTAGMMSEIKNCSIKDMKLKSVPSNTATSNTISGMTSTLNGKLNHCYVSDFEIELDTSRTEISPSAAGIVGKLGSSGVLLDSYASGKIKSLMNNGGLVGVRVANEEGKIQRCYSDVIIESSNEYNGGISVNTSSRNCLSVGSMMLSKADYNYAHRIAAKKNSYPIDKDNYAYSGQYFNNMDIGVDDATGLLTREQLSNKDTYLYTIKMGNAFDYSEVENGALPKVKNTNGELLPDQQSKYLSSDNVKMSVINSKQMGETYEVEVEVHHEGFDIQNITIDDMTELSIDKTTKNDVSVCTITSKKLKALDLYKLNVILKNKKNPAIMTLSSMVDYQGPVYWEISNSQQWQNIVANHKESSENFKIIGIIDFEGIKNPVLDVAVNRFIGQDKATSIIKNLTFNDSQGYNLIKNSMSGISDITFDNININYETSAPNKGAMGIIKQNSADLENCVFKNSKLNANLFNGSIIGMIGNNVGNIKNVEVSEILIEGTYKTVITGTNGSVGGLVGSCSGGMQNITGKNIIVNASESTSVGGIVGYQNVTYLKATSNNDISVENVSLKGKSNIGGIGGYNTTKISTNYSAKNVLIEGNGTNHGGIFGVTYANINNSELDGVSLQDITINSTISSYYIGGAVGTGTGIVYDINAKNINLKGGSGIGGILGKGNVSNSIIENVTVNAERFNAGGVAGECNNSVVNSEVRFANVRAKYAAGGVVGRGGCYTVTVVNADVQAEKYAGGIVGSGNVITDGEADIENKVYSPPPYWCAVYDTKVKTTKDYAGGIIGFSGHKTVKSTDWHNVVARCEIEANNYAGGFFGGSYGMDTNITTRYAIVRDTKITAKNNYAGGIAGCVILDNPNFSSYGGYVSNIDVHASSYAGGLFGYVQEVEGVTPIKRLRGYLIHNSRVSSVDKEKSNFVTYNYRDIVEDKNILGIKIEENSTLNGIKAKDAGIWQDPTREHIEVITEADIGDYDLLTNVYDPVTGTTKNSKRPGLAWATNQMSVYATLELGRDFSAVNGKNDFSFTPIDYTKHVFRVHADLPDGTYKIYSANKPSEMYDLVIKSKEGDVTISSVTCQFQRISLKLKVNEDTIWSSVLAYLSNYFTTAKVVEGQTYYEGNDVSPQTIILEDGDYTWYKDRNYNLGKDNSTSIVAGKGNQITIPSRGYYYAIDATNKKISPLFTFDTHGYLPSVVSGNTTPKYQEGLAVPGDYSTAYSVLDGLFEGEARLDYIPRTPSLGTLSSKARMATIEKKLPKLNVYSSGTDRINIEFNDSLSAYQDKGIQVKLSYGSTEKEYTVKERTLTIGYDYQTDIEIKVSYGKESYDYLVKAEDVIQSVSTYKNRYYYLVDDGVKDNDMKWQGDYIHLYHNEVLSKEQEIVSLKDSKKRKAAILGELLETKEIYSGENQGYQIKNYSTYSTTNNKEVNDMLLVKRGKLHIIDGHLEKRGIQVIVDVYNGKQIQCILQENGKLLNVIGEIKTPEGFRNEDIVEISGTMENDTTIMFVRYKDGTLVGFDYLSGKTIDVESQSKDIGFFDFMKTSFFSLFDAPVENIESKEGDVETFENELIQLDEEGLTLLEEAEMIIVSNKNSDTEKTVLTSEEKEEIIEKVEKQKSKNSQERQAYVTKYNAKEGKFETYQKQSILEAEEEIISENEKIKELEKNGLDIKQLKNEPQVNKINNGFPLDWVVIGTVFISISALLVVLYKKRKMIQN